MFKKFVALMLSAIMMITMMCQGFVVFAEEEKTPTLSMVVGNVDSYSKTNLGFYSKNTIRKYANDTSARAGENISVSFLIFDAKMINEVILRGNFDKSVIMPIKYEEEGQAWDVYDQTKSNEAIVQGGMLNDKGSYVQVGEDGKKSYFYLEATSEEFVDVSSTPLTFGEDYALNGGLMFTITFKALQSFDNISDVISMQLAEIVTESEAEPLEIKHNDAWCLHQLNEDEKQECGDYLICSFCGDIVAEPEKHVVEDGICVVCGAICNHRWGEFSTGVDGIETRYCENCDSVETRDCQFEVTTIEPTCQSQGYDLHTCKNCGANFRDEYTDIIDHIAGKETVEIIVDSTCKVEGTGDAVVKCTMCDYEFSRKTQSLPKKEHKPVLVSVVAPKCEKSGYTVYRCAECGSMYSTDPVKATGHNWVVDEAVEPTCTEDGKTQGEHCEYCGEVTVPQETIPALKHLAGETKTENKVEPTCIQDGGYDLVVRCENCTEIMSSEHITVEKIEHNYVADVTEPTCKDDGYTTYTCDMCQDSYVNDYKEKTGHKEVIKEHNIASCDSTGEIIYECETCGNLRKVIVPPTGEHNYEFFEVIEPTCTEDGYTLEKCSTCGETKKLNFVSPAGHKKSEEQKINEIVATCTSEGGYDIARVCTVCGEVFNPLHYVVGVLPHSYEAVVTPASCIAQGYTTYTCKNCGNSYIGNYVGAKGHTNGEPTVENLIDATCTQKGSYENVICCKDCGIELSRTTCVIEVKDHEYKANVIAATCTAQGYTIFNCQGCGHTYIGDIVPVAEHTNVVLEEKLSNCTEDGYKKFKCSVCGFAKTEIIESPGHIEVVDEGKPATCTETGISNGKHCSVCGKVLATQDVTPALGHKEQEISNAAATCTEEGYKVYKCNVCGEERKVVTKPALGHIEALKFGKDATCTETGLTDGKYCVTCNKVLQEQEVVSPTGHTSGKPVVENSKDATCTEEGSYESVVKCTVCKAEVSREKKAVEKVEHQYIKNTVAATCVDLGKDTYTCKVCGYSYDEYGELGDHNYTAKKVKPTYYADGYTLYTCDTCGVSTKGAKTKKLALAKTKITKLTGKSKAFAVSYKKVSGATGYQIEYSRKKNFTYSKTTKTTSVSKTIKGLKGGNTYYVRVRAYHSEKGKKTVYSPWVSKTVKVKK